MKFPFSKKIFSVEETSSLADDFVKILAPGDVVILNGNLGAGKTFFVKQILKKFNIDFVNSPTFAIVNEYYGKYIFYHFDFYRINREVELFDIGINDYLNNVEAITFIEWGNMFPDILPKKRIEIDITLSEDYSRQFYFIKYE